MTRLEVVGGLAIAVEDDLLPLIEHSWLPRRPGVSRGFISACIHIRRGRADSRAPLKHPTLRLGTARLWIEEGARLALAGDHGCSGSIGAQGLDAELITPAHASNALGSDLYSMLTISTALLLGRMGQALVHAAAVVSPVGVAWMIIGDARSGKSTTTANLVSSGWKYLSDDQVVLRRERDGVGVEGLLRLFHLDEGWGAERPASRRCAVDPLRRWPDQWVDRAPLGTLLFPNVSAVEPTTVRPVAPADAMAALVRQSPWVLADPTAAPTVLGLLREAAAAPGYALSLGLDTFGDGALLEKRILSVARASAA